VRVNPKLLEAGTHILINVTRRQLHHLQGDKAVQVYPVATGKPSTPTPPGKYQVVNKRVNPGGVLGTRWMGLSIPGGIYGIHGTNNADSIGKAISNGCIRMHNQHVEQLFPHVNIGTPVVITAGQNDSGYNDPKNGRTYVVQPGDTMWVIAGHFGIPLEVLLQANPQVDPDALFPGQIITIMI